MTLATTGPWMESGGAMRHIHVAPVFWLRSVIEGAVPPVKSMICSGMNTD